MPGQARLQYLALLLTAFLVLAPAAASADPLIFGNVVAVQLDPLDVTRNIVTDLFATPGAVLTNGTHVSFFVDVEGLLPPATSDTLRLTHNQPGGVGTVIQDFPIPAFDTVFPPFTAVLGLEFPVSYHPLPVALTVDLLASSPDYIIPGGPMAGQAVDSYTFSFSVVQPVPEPATVVLLAIGLGAAGLNGIRRARRRRGRD